eukprot:COSAG01_NODE_1325_length_10718_cov_50.476787_6_plen_89_part_00
MDQQLDERCVPPEVELHGQYRLSASLRVALSIVMPCRLLPLRLSPLFVDLVLGRLRLEHSSDDRETITNLDSLPFDQLCATQIKGGAS